MNVICFIFIYIIYITYIYHIFFKKYIIIILILYFLKIDLKYVKILLFITQSRI